MTNFRFKQQDGTFVYFEHIDAGIIEEKDSFVCRDIIKFNDEKIKSFFIDNQKDYFEDRRKRYEALKDALLKIHNIDLEKCQRLQMMWANFDDWWATESKPQNTT